MVMRVPDYSIRYNFPESDGLSFRVRTDRRNVVYTEFTGRVSAVIGTDCLQVYKDGEIFNYDSIRTPWQLEVCHNGKRTSSYGSHYFKSLMENESLYLQSKITQYLEPNIVNVSILDFTDDYSAINVEFFNNNVKLVIDNAVINTFEDFVPKTMYDQHEETYRWEKLLSLTIGQSYPFLILDDQMAKEISIKKAKNNDNTVYNEFIITSDTSGLGYNIEAKK